MKVSSVSARPFPEVGSSPATTILIIDDDELLAFGLGKLLERHGYQTRIATHGRHGLQIVRSAAIDLVITDIYMAEMEGLETIIQLRRDHPELKVIAMSGGAPHMGTSALTMALKLGANEALDKPVRIDRLLEVFARLGYSPNGTPPTWDHAAP
jgi:DNA-binding NtrC family response regulator